MTPVTILWPQLIARGSHVDHCRTYRNGTWMARPRGTTHGLGTHAHLSRSVQTCSLALERGASATLSCPGQFRAVRLLVARKVARGLVVLMAVDVDHIAVWRANEEPSHAPRLCGERMNDLEAASFRFLVRLLDTVADGDRDH